MRVSLQWLNDYIDSKKQFSLDDISEALTKAGLEVESVESFEDDHIFSLSVTPNRADALSHLGVAREICASFDVPMRSPLLSPTEMSGLTHEKIAIEIDDNVGCNRYATRIIEGVQVHESPSWLKKKLLSCGISPINNIVDVTNFVMLDRGQPMHAFDFEKINKNGQRAKILVRNAKEGEELLLLNGTIQKLTLNDLVIADNDTPIALAGIMGGSFSSVGPQTTTIMLESAFFESTKIRSTSKRINLSTESSFRFERGVDPNGVIEALNYAARLICEISPTSKVRREPIDLYKKRVEPIEVKMRLERAREILGLSKEDFNGDLLRRKLVILGIETIAKPGDALYFRIPTFRADITREIDMIEEAIRIFGYEKVDSKKALCDIRQTGFIDKNLEKTQNLLRNYLVARGFNEAINYAFQPLELIELFTKTHDKKNLIEVKNPLSARLGAMTPSLFLGLVSNLSHNLRNQEKEVFLFESGTVFLGRRQGANRPNPKAIDKILDVDSYALEEERLAGILSGKIDFVYLKSLIEDCLGVLKFNTTFPYNEINFVKTKNNPYFHPVISADIYYNNKILLGSMGKLRPDIKTKLDISQEVFLFELNIKNISDLLKNDKKFFKPFSMFPFVERDVAFLVDEAIKIEDLLNAVKQVENYQELLTSLKVFDIYRGKNLEANKKSVAISLKMQRSDRTLTDNEVDDFISSYIKMVEEKTGAKLRA